MLPLSLLSRALSLFLLWPSLSLSLYVTSLSSLLLPLSVSHLDLILPPCSLFPPVVFPSLTCTPGSHNRSSGPGTLPNSGHHHHKDKDAPPQKELPPLPDKAKDRRSIIGQSRDSKDGSSSSASSSAASSLSSTSPLSASSQESEGAPNRVRGRSAAAGSFEELAAVAAAEKDKRAQGGAGSVRTLV